MSNTINPYGASRPELQRTVQSPELDEDGQRQEHKKIDVAQPGNLSSNGEAEIIGGRDKIDQASNQEQLNAAETNTSRASKFGTTLEGVIDRDDDITGNLESSQSPNLEGLSPAEQQLIYRYFPESPSLELRLYKPDMSTNKVDPGSVGSRVDVRG